MRGIRRAARFRRVGISLAACIALAMAQPVAADGLADEAELQFQLGADRYRTGDFRGALEHFLASNRLVPNANVVFNIARAYESLQRFADAHRYYVDALESTSLTPRVRTEIEGAIARIAPNVAVLRVETTPAGATIYIDRRDLGSRGRSPRALAFPAGRYRIIAELEGYEPAESDPIDAQLGSETPVRLELRRIVGNVRIEGDPGAVVHVDDEHGATACASPCNLELPPGPHTLYFSREGFQLSTRSVNVVARQTSTVRAALQAQVGTVVVSADERDALVEIDGRSVGFTPAVVPGVSVGRRHVRVSLRGYSSIERDVIVRAGQQAELLDLRLLPVREVTAVSRVAESIDDAPSSLSIIGSPELRAFAYPTIAESLRGIRGVYLSNDRAYVSAGIRGLGEPNDYGNRVLVLSDGASLNDNLLNSSYIGSDGRADLHDIERIEVIRGPGSLLYGTGAFSGVINLVTRRRDEPTSVHGGFGTYDNGVLTARAGFNVNFGRDRGVWASVSGARSDGFDLTMQVPDGMGGTTTRTANRVDSFAAVGTAGRAWWGPVTAQWFFHTREQHIPIGAVGTAFNDPRTNYWDSRYLGEVRFEPWLSRRVQLFTRVHANHYGFQGLYYYPKPSLEEYGGTWFGAEARILIFAFPGNRITIGGEGQYHPQADIWGCCQSDPNSGDALFGRRYINEHRPYAFGAGYAILDQRVTNWFRISAGARVDVYSTFGPIFVPRGALIFRPVTGGVLKVMGGRAFRAPSIYESYYNDGGVTQNPAVQPNRSLTLGPESVYSAEIEYSQRFLEDWVALAAVHASYVEGLVETVDDPTADCPTCTRYANGTAPIGTLGADLELRREFRQGWMITANASYQRAQYLDGVPYPASWVPNAPEFLAGARAIVPIVPGVATGAVRIAAETGRRVTNDVLPTAAGGSTAPAVLADAVISGNVARFGVRWAIGVYNLLDWRWSVPVTQTYLAPTMPQNGRTFRFDLVVTY